MLYNFVYPALSKIHVFNVLRYPSFRMVMAAITALLLTILVYPWFIRVLTRLSMKQSIRNDGPQAHLVTKVGTPTMGGALILLAVVISTLLWADLAHAGIWMLLIIIVGYGAIGLYDDMLKVIYRNPKGLSGRWKLFWQTAIGALVVGMYLCSFTSMPSSTLITLPFVAVNKFHVMLPVSVYGIFAVFLLVGTSNAVNLTDGLDGLAIGPVIINTFVFMILAYAAGTTLGSFNIAQYLGISRVEGAAELSVFCGAVIGAGTGFLWYNAYPATIFMGDVGSLALGGALGLLALLTNNEILSALINGVFLIEALSVIMQVASFKIRGKRIFRMAPIHHHFELVGWSESKIIVRFWILSSVFALIALASLKLR